jgi:hypothetical protein
MQMLAMVHSLVQYHKLPHNKAAPILPVLHPHLAMLLRLTLKELELSFLRTSFRPYIRS